MATWLLRTEWRGRVWSLVQKRLKSDTNTFHLCLSHNIKRKQKIKVFSYYNV